MSSVWAKFFSGNPKPLQTKDLPDLSCADIQGLLDCEDYNTPCEVMKTIKSPRQRNEHRFKRGCHPDSLANLNGSSTLYEVRKVYFSIGVTPDTKEKLKKIADNNGLSLSEAIERIGRGLSVEAIQKLVRPGA